MTKSFFTRPSQCYEVPNDRIGVRWVLVAHQAVTKAFEIIRKAGFSLGQALENEITVELESALNNKVLDRGEVDGFDKGFWGLVRRVEIVNFDGSKQSKKPDLCFCLQREHRVEWDRLQDALFAECKPVDRTHSLAGHYCAVSTHCTGIERFIIGDYAWAMEEAMMIGYVRDSFSVLPHLAAALDRPLTRQALGDPTPILSIHPVVSGKTAITLYQTTHKRTFSWINGNSATPIEIFHSWHDCQ